MFNKFKGFSNIHYSRVFFVLSFIFVSLCLLHFFSQRPFWNDEQCVFENIKASGYLQLFAPLSHVQVFPRVHLIIIKAISSLFDNHVLAVRSLSLIFMLCAFFVWMNLYKVNYKNKMVALLAIAAFAFSQRMSYYAAEFKPYAMDVLALGLFSMFFQHQKYFCNKNPTGKLYFLSIIMPALILFSYASLFAVWIISFNYLFMLKDNKKLFVPLVVNIVSSAICFYILFRTDLQYSLSENGLYLYWKDYFLSTKNLYAFFTPLGEGIREIASYWYGNSKFYIRAATPFIPIFVFSLFYYGYKGIKKDKFRIFSLDTISIVLFIELIILSMLKKYPFTGDRVTLFFAPFVFYLTVKGIDSLKKFGWINKLFVTLYSGFLIMCLINSVKVYLGLYI